MSRGLRVVAAATLVVGVAGATLAVEVAVALRRDYIRTAPAAEIGGTFDPPDGARGRPLRFVVLGDSTAAGLGAGSADRSYPVLLARRLAEAGFRVDLIDLGVSGARTADVAAKQAPGAAAAHPDLVLVAIGGNDVTHLTHLAAVRHDMRAALVALRATGARVVVAGVPDMRAHAFLEPLRSIAGRRGRVVSRAIEAVARDQGVAFVPLAERTGHFFAEDPGGTFSSDLFHPGPGGYRRWADAIYPALAQALEAAPAPTASAGS
ncbi:MAG TPA: SGNH/GDSL hydrolase family protein [Actinomycetota bacterium]